MKQTKLKFQIHLYCFLCYYLFLLQVCNAQTISDGFYRTTCPQLDAIVRTSVRAAGSVDASLPPKLLRLMFHDCFVEGCDASVLLTSDSSGPTEIDDPGNASVRGIGVIDNIKRAVELLCPGVVSCADIVVLAARDAVALMGGPRVQVPTGRKDGLVSSAAKVSTNLPDTPFSLDQLLTLFERKGLELEDVVALSGAHTVGVAHCTAVNDRFTFGRNGSLVSQDPSMDPTYAAQLVQRCPANPSASTLIVNDLRTPSVFDNAYYANLEVGRGLFHSDAVLASDKRSAGLVRQFAASQEAFFAAWERSFRRLSLVGVKTGSAGQIRRRCNLRN